MIIQNDYGFKELKHKTLKEYFSTIKDIQERNRTILLAIEDGYTQTEIGRCLKISFAMVSKIFRGV